MRFYIITFINQIYFKTSILLLLKGIIVIANLFYIYSKNIYDKFAITILNTQNYKFINIKNIF